MNKTLRTLILVMVAALTAAACSGVNDAGTASFGGDAATESPNTTVAAATSLDAEGGLLFDADSADGVAPPEAMDERAALTNAQAVLTSLDVVDLGRSIIFTANINIEVEDVVTAGAEIKNAIAGLGGVLFGQETSTGDNPRSILTIKVRPEDFDDALDRLAGVGELISQTVFADDVTDRVVDLESRITTSEVSVLRLRALLEGAVNLDDVVELEAELLKRETDLEVLRGQLRTLEDAVSLATIVVVLTEPEPEIPAPAIELVQTAYMGHDGGSSCPGNEEVTIDEGDLITICFELTNVGDTLLGEIEVTDFGLDMDEGDPVVVEGDLSVPLQPEGRIILAFETTADPDQYTGPNVSVTALDADGDPIRVQVSVEIQDAFLRIARDNSLPGFADGLKAAWDAMQQVFGVVVLAAGAAIPFLWVPAVAGGVWYWRKRRDSSVD